VKLGSRNDSNESVRAHVLVLYDECGEGVQALPSVKSMLVDADMSKISLEELAASLS